MNLTTSSEPEEDVEKRKNRYHKEGNSRIPLLRNFLKLPIKVKQEVIREKDKRLNELFLAMSIRKAQEIHLPQLIELMQLTMRSQ